MGLMGMSPDGVTVAEAFNPNDEVTRAQYGTILSRLLRWLDNAAEDGELYYTHHLAALKNAHIMTKIADPSMKELRGRVMVMLKRIYDLGN